jgi:HEAT repeat protein
MLLPASLHAATEPASRLLEVHDLLGAHATALQALVADPSLGDAEILPLLEHEDWRVRLEAGLVLGWRRDAERYARLWSLQVPRDHAGLLRVPEALVADPALAPILLERVLRGGDASGARAAWVGALPMTGGDWSEATAALARDTQEPEILRACMDVARRAEPPHALEILRVGLSHADPTVRAEAARAAGWRKDGALLAPGLITALRDRDSETRAMAARSLGWLGHAEAWRPLLPLLDDASGEVRLQALRALERLDAARTARLPRLQTLAEDPDPKVSRAARQISGSPR